MKAIVCTEYGSLDALKLKVVDKPLPKDNEVLIKIHATTVTTGDWRIRSGTFPRGFGLISRLACGFFRPRKSILGSELAGEIESVGKKVTKFKAGDAVVAMSGFGLGCHAEYRCMPEDGTIALKPSNLTFEEAAALSFGSTTACYFLRNRGKIQKGEKVLINGASGSVGIAAVQLARYFGAHVTGVCSTPNLALIKAMGAHEVIDYTKENFAENGETYDIILDTIGTVSFSSCKDSLNNGGRLLLVSAGLSEIVQAPWVSITSTKKVIAGPANHDPKTLQFVMELAKAGKFKSVVDRYYPLEQIAEAYAYVEKRHKRGNVVITLKNNVGADPLLTRALRLE